MTRPAAIAKTQLYSWQRVLTLLMLAAAVTLAIAACGDEEIPTQAPGTVPLATAASAPMATLALTPSPTPAPMATPAPSPSPTDTPVARPASTPAPSPSPVPTNTPTPTSAAEPTQAPVPTSVSDPGPVQTTVPGPTTVEEELAVAEGLSGEEVLAMLTQEEVRCMQDTFGEALLEQIKDLRITSQVASDPDSRFLFQCITPESINRVGLALIRADAPLSEETAACILEVLQESDNDLVAVSLLEAGSGALECLNNEEALSTFRQMNYVLDQRSALRGRDILLMLSPTERTCVRERVDEAVLVSVEDATVMESFEAAPSIFGCIEADNLPAIFINVSDSRMGGLSDETQACARSKLTSAMENDPQPHLVQFSLGATSNRPEQYEQAIALSRDIFGCMNDDELIEIQGTIADALP